MTDAAVAANDERITGDILKIAGVVVLGAIMSILDITVVNVALPTFETTFGSAGHPLAYSTAAVTICAAAFLPPQARDVSADGGEEVPPPR